MAEGIATRSHAVGSQIRPELRQRMRDRAATYSEGAQSTSPLDRRSSTISDFSDSRRPFFRPSANDLDPLISSDEPSFWHSAPLAFAILPAVGGLLFQNGSSVVTDVLLLGLASMFLNWCVRAPWYAYTRTNAFHSLSKRQGLVSRCTAGAIRRCRRRKVCRHDP